MDIVTGFRPSPKCGQLIGRDREVRFLLKVLDGDEPQSRRLLIRGDPGIGKSALLAAVAEAAVERGFECLRVVGAESEAHLPFAGLHQLLRPVLEGMTELQPRLREALMAVFGMAEVPVADHGLVGPATLELLAGAHSGRPALVISEDLQWMDMPTRDVMRFVSRRGVDAGLVMFATVRTGFEVWKTEPPCPELILSGLTPWASAELLSRTAPDLAGPTRARIIAEADGNPLALLELPKALCDGGREETVPALLPDRLERAFAGRIAELPETTQALLLLAAADERADVHEVVRGANLLLEQAVSSEDLVPAMRAAILEPGELSTRFRHPLLRSAVYQSAAGRARQRAHSVMAEVLAGQPDRRVWHRAVSAVRSDEDLAQDLVEAADRACGAGDVESAVGLLERGAELTPDRPLRGHRLLRAAETAFEIGRPALVGRLIDAAEALPLSLADRSRAHRVRGLFDDGWHDSTAGIETLLRMSEHSALDGDHDLAMQLLEAAARQCWWGDPGEVARRRVVEAGERLQGVVGEDPRLLAVFAIADPTGYAGWVLERLSHAAADPSRDPRHAGVLATAAFAVGDLTHAVTFADEAVEVLRRQGRLALLAQVLVLRASCLLYLGDLAATLTDSEEAHRLAVETAQPMWAAAALVCQGTVAGLRGDETGGTALVLRIEQAAVRMRGNAFASSMQLVRGVVALGAGRHSEAYEHLRRIFDPADAAFDDNTRFQALGYLAEAAVAVRRHDEVKALLGDLQPAISRLPTAQTQFGVRYACAALADPDEAEPLFDAALTEAADWPFHRARLQLARGRRTRRDRRAVEARPFLREAKLVFDDLGMAPWSELACGELHATGESGSTGTRRQADLLTGQERQIVELVAAGYSNREIGERLFISRRTVGSHLYRLFPKLGVTSRNQVARVIEQGNLVQV